MPERGLSVQSGRRRTSKEVSVRRILLKEVSVGLLRPVTLPGRTLHLILVQTGSRQDEDRFPVADLDAVFVDVVVVGGSVVGAVGSFDDADVGPHEDWDEVVEARTRGWLVARARFSFGRLSSKDQPRLILRTED